MFDAAELMDAAARETGLTDYGPAPLLDGLTVLCKALNTEARLHAAGEAHVRGELLEILRERLKVQSWLSAHPEIDEQPIVAPIVVTGLPRSGTSALSQMLAQDPANRTIRRWEGAEPTPPPELATEADDPRVARTQAVLDRRYAASPEMLAMNPVTVHDATESECFLKHTFEAIHFCGVYRVPSYQAWILTRDLRGSYRYMRSVLRLLQWKRPPTRWNLKYPPDLFALEALTDAFPDARLVWTHRDPVSTVPSVASLLVARRRPHTDSVDKPELGRSEFAMRQEQIRRGLAYRDSAGALPIADVRNVDLIADPIGVVRGLYDTLGLAFTPQFEAALARRVVEKPKGRFGAHTYTAEEFGLDEAELRRAFAPYTDRFLSGARQTARASS